MIPDLIARCDKCGQAKGELWDDPGDLGFYCTDCYLRKHGFDPQIVGQHFAKLAQEAIAQLLYEKNAIQPHCGHPVSAIVSSGEGTSYCGACVKEG